MVRTTMITFALFGAACAGTPEGGPTGIETADIVPSLSNGFLDTTWDLIELEEVALEDGEVVRHTVAWTDGPSTAEVFDDAGVEVVQRRLEGGTFEVAAEATATLRTDEARVGDALAGGGARRVVDVRARTFAVDDVRDATFRLEGVPEIETVQHGGDLDCHVQAGVLTCAGQLWDQRGELVGHLAFLAVAR